MRAAAFVQVAGLLVIIGSAASASLAAGGVAAGAAAVYVGLSMERA